MPCRTARPIPARCAPCALGWKSGRGYAKPAHALAMAAGEAARFQSLQLSGEQAGCFVRGHEVPCPAALSGWTIARYHNLPLGWGKAVNGTLKNHLPKGLRLNG